MIKFEFVLEDVDAENLISIIKGSASKDYESILDLIAEGKNKEDASMKCHFKNIEYVDNLAKKVSRGTTRISN